MKIRIFIFIGLFVPCYLFSQNLVPNSSFENYNNCPNNFSQIYYAVPWFQPNTWQGNTTNSSSSDYFNTCTGYSDISVPSNFCGTQYPKTGLAYSGICCFDKSNPSPNKGREYIETQLSDSLIKGEKYLISFYVSLADKMNYSIDAIGAYVSKGIVLYNDISGHYLPYDPQIKNTQGNAISDSINWVQISGEFIAKGGEKFITIGNFSVDSVITVDTLNHNTFYNVSYYYIDDVSVTLDSGVGIEKHSSDNNISIYPNPSSGDINIETNIQDANGGKLQIMNMLGKCVSVYSLNNGNSKLIIHADELDEGIYFFEISVNNKIVKHEKVVIIR